MKRAGIITTAGIAALVLAGGGITLGAALSNTDEPDNAIIETIDPTETAEPTASATPDETATVEPTDEPVAIPTATAYSETEQMFVDWATPNLTFWGLDVTAQQLVDAMQPVCEGESFPFPDASDKANQYYRDGIENGYFVDGVARSYCD